MRAGLPLDNISLLIGLVAVNLLIWLIFLPGMTGGKMSDRYVIEAMLRPAVELNTAVVAACASYICVTAPWAVALAPSVSYVTAAGFAVLSMKRTQQGLRVLRYRRNIRRLPRYVVTSSEVPVSNQRLFLGKGFMWGAKHTQRLLDTLRPEVAGM